MMRMSSLERCLALGSLVFVVIVLGACTGPQSTGGEEESQRVYHVQVRMTEDKAKAERTLGTVLEWWTQSAPAHLPQPVETEQASPVKIAYRPPLYRVRLGPFASREEAETVLAAAQEAYPEAFVVPGRRSASRAAP